jgi:phosphate starvation-inducible protein PhoH and related proteins
LSPQSVHLFLQQAGWRTWWNRRATDKRAAPVVIQIRRANIRSRGPHQQQYLQGILEYDVNFGIGPAGTGKTYLAVACAVQALEQERVRAWCWCARRWRRASGSAFLPGDLAQKVDPYLRPAVRRPVRDARLRKVAKLIERNVIEIAPLAFMRGRTLNDAFIILDEAQNTTVEQMKMFLTRIGFGSTAVVTGDVTQIDLPRGGPGGGEPAAWSW